MTQHGLWRARRHDDTKDAARPRWHPRLSLRLTLVVPLGGDHPPLLGRTDHGVAATGPKLDQRVRRAVRRNS
jgi:hypothetical protein